MRYLKRARSIDNKYAGDPPALPQRWTAGAGGEGERHPLPPLWIVDMLPCFCFCCLRPRVAACFDLLLRPIRAAYSTAQLCTHKHTRARAHSRLQVCHPAVASSQQQQRCSVASTSSVSITAEFYTPFVKQSKDTHAQILQAARPDAPLPSCTGRPPSWAVIPCLLTAFLGARMKCCHV